MMKSAPLSSITPFRVLAHGPNQQAQNQLELNLAFAKRLAYFYWVTIASVAFLSPTKAT
jgi:hypothetical protein